MFRTSTTNYLFRLRTLLLLGAIALLAGCETEQTTTVRDGFGMSFTESNADSQNDNYGVNID